MLQIMAELPLAAIYLLFSPVPQLPQVIVMRPTHVLIALLLYLSILPLMADQPIDAVATKAITSATTSPEFITDWVATLPEDANVPSPRDVLGYTVGTPGELTHVDDIHRYISALAEASPNVALISLGKSFEGREMLTVVISDAETLENIETFRDFTDRLSDPRRTTAEEAAGIIAEAKPIYWVTGGLHSTELGPPEASMELAYRLAVDQRDLFRKIRQEVIVFITPVLETDGRARQVEWYRQHLSEFTGYYGRPPTSPPFWGHYTFHDNNRDGLTFSQPLTRNYVEGFFNWKPTMSLDMHESVPLLYVSTGTGPYNNAVDPITVTEWQSISNYEVSRLTAKGLPGVWTWGFYTGWFPGYLLWVTNNHNANGRFYETFGNGSANTMHRDLRNNRFAGNKVTDRTWYRAMPPDREFEWSMRNNANYMQSAVIASLELVAGNPEVYLGNFYQKGVNAMARAIAEAPYAFVIPRQQSDRGAAVKLLSVLDQHGIEMHQANEVFELDDDNSVSKGDVVILLNQPYGPLAQNLLEKQEFPSKVEVPPYDDVAWTLGLQFGVRTIAIENRDILAIAAKPLSPDVFEDDNPVSGRGRYLIVNHQGQSGLGPFRFALGAIAVKAAGQSFSAGGKEFSAGSLIIDSEGASRETLEAILKQHSLTAVAIRRLPQIGGQPLEVHEMDLPRVAVYHSWIATQNAGWARYSLDRDEVPYTLVSKDDVRQGNLRESFDVLIAPALWGRTTLAQLIAGVNEKWSPLPYETTKETPSLGHIMESEDITGGLGFIGMEEIAQFIRQGGTFIGLADGGVLASSSGITPDIRTARPAGLNTPGSILTTKVLGDHPLTRGYDEWTYVFRGNGPLYTVADYNRHMVMMQFGGKVVPEPSAMDEAQDTNDSQPVKAAPPPLVRSGAILSGESAIDGAPALLHNRVGEGNVVLFSWNPLHRNINHHDHAFFYNALLNWNDLPVPTWPVVP
jgi:hypothetical protein